MPTKTYREEQGNQIPGLVLYAYIRNAGYHLTEIIVYQDGMVDCWGLMDFDNFVQKVDQQWVVTNLKAGTRIHLPFIAPGEHAVLEADTQADESEFVKEVHDTIQALNGTPTTAERFQKAVEHWRQSKNKQSLTTIQKAYEAIPKWGLNEYYVYEMLTSDEWRQISEGEHKAVQ